MKSLGRNRGFLALLVTQFFGAANDNVLKQVITIMLATGIWAGSIRGMENAEQVLPALCLTLPFILLSGFAGELADRFSKRTVMITVKLAELPIAIIACIGFMSGDVWTALIAMLLLSIQSTFFGPAKYGIIPEIVEDRQLSRANGVLNMLTNIAIITGLLIAGPVSDWYAPVQAEGEPAKLAMGWAPGVVLIVIAAMGLVAVTFMPRVPPADPTLRPRLNPFRAYIKSIREMAKGPLLIVAMAWAFFYMVGMMALLIVPEYEVILKLTSHSQATALLGVLAIAIGIGSVAAGYISGQHIEPRLVPIGAIGLTTSFFLLGALPPNYWTVAAFIFTSGIFAGFYIVPLQAMLQKLSPDDERGRFLGTANALSFCFSTAGALAYWVTANKNLMGMPPNRIFLVCGGLALVVTGYVIWRLWNMRDRLVE